MLGGPTPTLTLKRPRSTSQPPSPNSTSSPKRAASEDPFASSSDIAAGSAHLPDANGNGYLNTMSAGQQGNSPLRSDVDGEGGSLVDRTEEVSLVDGEGMDGVIEEGNGNSALREQYNMLLGELWDLSTTVNELHRRQADDGSRRNTTPLRPLQPVLPFTQEHINGNQQTRAGWCFPRRRRRDRSQAGRDVFGAGGRPRRGDCGCHVRGRRGWQAGACRAKDRDYGETVEAQGWVGGRYGFRLHHRGDVEETRRMVSACRGEIKCA
jgi:hypothetical protein